MSISAEAIKALVGELEAQVTESTIVTPESPEYGQSIKRWAASAERKAAICVMAKSAEDISKALLLAQKYKIDIAVRGGGHFPSGNNSSEGGLVIDLSKMREVTVDVENKTAKCQGGCLWEDVDITLAKYGLAAVGGTVNTTGVAGLTLGGGYGWLSGQYGLTIDNLLSVKVVLADGRIVVASETENQDLFWALRGAGHNFGVAVDFTYRAHDLDHEVYAGALVFGAEKLEQIVNFLNTLGQDSDGKAGAMLAVDRPIGEPSADLAIIVFYDGPEDVGKQKFSPLLDLETRANTVTMRPYTEVNTLLNDTGAGGGRYSFHGASFSLPLDPAFAQKTFDELAPILDKNPELSGTGFLWEFHNSKKIHGVARDSMAFANRGQHQNVTLVIRHNNPARYEEFREEGRRIQKIIRDNLVTKKGYGENDVNIYGNYVDDPRPNEVFGTNLEKLQKLKGIYDPGNIFNKMHPISPVLEN
ncbi:hypothetical protein FQN54_004870 [Arachnomyces sp. PD_36]|nr:hypothetical protein FQN54_004870 [Arachnomyces sp. PD_36]